MEHLAHLCPNSRLPLVHSMPSTLRFSKGHEDASLHFRPPKITPVTSVMPISGIRKPPLQLLKSSFS
ncbi:hypothetical protein V6N12_037552 [Hibiscus sabdariffa]